MHLDYRLPVPFLGAIAAVLMLLYPVRLLLIFLLMHNIHDCYYNFNFKAMFLIASVTFALAERGRIGFEALLPAFDSVNTTGIALGATTLQLFRDIAGGIVVGIPGSHIIIQVRAYNYNIKSMSLNSGCCTVSNSCLHYLCSDIITHDWLNKVCC